MVDKKACKVRKFKINGAVFATRLTLVVIVMVLGFTVYSKLNNNSNDVVESSAYIDMDGVSSMAQGVKNGAVYTSSVTPEITNVVAKAKLTRDGQEIKFKSGRKISKMGSYILTLEDKSGNIDTIYFDIEN